AEPGARFCPGAVAISCLEKSTTCSAASKSFPAEQLLIGGDDVAVPPGVTEPGIQGQCDRDPDQDGTGLIPGSIPPAALRIAVMQFSRREQSQKKNHGDDLPRGLVLA